MSIFGWSYPPGVSSVPGDEDWVADLTPYITLRGDADGVYWDEDGRILESFPILVKTDGWEYYEGDYRTVGKFPWNDDLSDEENFRAAAIRTWLRKHVPGFGAMKFSDDELIRSFILPARAWVERGASEKAPQTSDAPAFARTDTDAFKAWFGDSKVVDKDGKPLVVYHGTAGEFNVFEPSQYGATKGGIFFTPDKATADAFANLAYENGNGDANTMAVYLAIRNPKVIEAAEIMDGKEHSFEREFAAVKKARDEGFDGLHIRNVPDQYRVADQWVAFSPEQIKSATGNHGTFDPNNADVRF